jgi:hypothetical protein
MRKELPCLSSESLPILCRTILTLTQISISHILLSRYKVDYHSVHEALCPGSARNSSSAEFTVAETLHWSGYAAAWARCANRLI